MGVIGHLQNDSKNMSCSQRIFIEKLSHLYHRPDSTIKTVLTCKSATRFQGLITKAGPPVFVFFSLTLHLITLPRADQVAN